jgi:hypothetical protein
MVIVIAKRLSLLSDTLLFVIIRPTRFSLSINATLVPTCKMSGKMTRKPEFIVSRIMPTIGFMGTHTLVVTLLLLVFGF